MESPESSLVPGYRLDRYELLCPIASGGMATVWLARLRGKRGFEKLYAIKTIKTELISDQHFQEMFLDEARIASRIIHPNVAQILELGEQEDILYIVMEYVDGESVAKISRLANRLGAPLPPGVAMRIVAETCAGLHAAHQLKDASGERLGVVHRDVSPQNILLSSEGAAKVIDFGLVKARNRRAAQTETGVVKGKIRYMAPEQVARGASIDHRADVWACGMCLYELLTGNTPYDDEDDLDVVKRLMSNDPLPRLKGPLPEPIEQVLAQAIVANPAARFPTCAAMRRAIEDAIHQLGLAAEGEDVAAFLETTLPEVAAKRGAAIAKAIDSADRRHSEEPPTRSSVDSLTPDDVAYAQTEVSSRDRLSDGVVPLTRKRGEGGSRVLRAGGDSDGVRGTSSTSAATLTDQLKTGKSRSGVGFWLAALAVVGAAAWIFWPRGHVEDTSAGPAASASVAPSAAPSLAATPPVIPIDAASLTTLDLDEKPAAPSPTKRVAPRASAAAASSARAAAAASARASALSPAGASAAAVMLEPKPTESAAPPPPAPPPPAPPPPAPPPPPAEP